MAGHSDPEKTFAQVAQRYYWPRYHSEVGEYVRSCQVCQQYNVEQKAPASHMGRRVVERPWQVVAGDIIGPLPRSSKGHEYVLVFQDLFTKWVEALAIRKVKAKTVIEEINRRIFLRFSCAEVFLSDNGTELQNQAIDEFLTVTLRRTTLRLTALGVQIGP